MKWRAELIKNGYPRHARRVKEAKYFYLKKRKIFSILKYFFRKFDAVGWVVERGVSVLLVCWIKKFNSQPVLLTIVILVYGPLEEVYVRRSS